MQPNGRFSGVLWGVVVFMLLDLIRGVSQYCITCDDPRGPVAAAWRRGSTRLSTLLISTPFALVILITFVAPVPLLRDVFMTDHSCITCSRPRRQDRLPGGLFILISIHWINRAPPDSISLDYVLGSVYCAILGSALLSRLYRKTQWCSSLAAKLSLRPR